MIRRPGDGATGVSAVEEAGQELGQAVHGDPVLCHGVPIADGDCAVLEAVEVDSDAIRGADLILTRIALPDIAAVVE